MHRHHRGHFVAFGLLPVLNAVALLIQGLNLSTHGMGNSGRSLVVILVAAAVSLLCATVSAVKRGRDLGYPTLTTSLAIVASLMLGPVFLVLLVYLAFAKAADPAPSTAGAPVASMGIQWLWAPVLLVAPWMALLVASALP